MLAALKDISSEQWMDGLAVLLGMIIAYLKARNSKLGKAVVQAEKGVQVLTTSIEVAHKDRDDINTEAMKKLKELIAVAAKDSKVDDFIHSAAKMAQGAVEPKK